MRALLIAAAFCFAVHAQNNTAPNTANLPHFTVKGRVVNAVTGEPVKGALVNINGMEQHSGFTGADGQFEVDGVPKGNTFVSATHPGYSNTIQQKPQMLDVSDNVDGLTVKLPPTARISGTVRDSDGEPVEGLRVTCLQEMVMQGRKHLMPHGGTTTDEGGHFLLDNLQAGSYYLGTGQKAVYPGLPLADEAARLTFAAQYYPNSPDLNSAQKVEVKAGDDNRVDITVPIVRGARVYFSVTPPAKFVWGTLESEDGQTVINTPFMPDKKTGKFLVSSAPPGAWKLVVNAQQQGGARVGVLDGSGNTGEALINVAATDLDNVQITLSNPVDIPVNFIGADAQQQQQQPPTVPSRKSPVQTYIGNGPSARVSLQPASSSTINVSNRRGMMQAMNQEGGAVIKNVQPGTYRVVVQNWNGQNCVDSVTSGSLDLAHNDLVVSAGSPPQPINVSLMATCGQLDISVNQKAQANVLIIPDSHSIEPISAMTSSDKTTLGNLSPGDYTVYAFTDVNGLEYMNPEVMRTFSGQHVTLAAGQKASLTLDVIDREAK
jgi:uncharacterized protein (DUF2141 family)